MSTSPRSDVVQWQDRSTIQLLEHIASLEKEANIESQRATHYREQWQTSLMALNQLQARIKRLEELVEIGGRMADIGQKIVHQGGEDMYWIRKLEEELTEWAIAKRDDPHYISPHGPVSQKCETTPPSETT